MLLKLILNQIPSAKSRGSASSARALEADLELEPDERIERVGVVGVLLKLILNQIPMAKSSGSASSESREFGVSSKEASSADDEH